MQTAGEISAAASKPAAIHFSTDQWPEAHRLSLLREVVGPGQLRLHIEPLSARFRVEGTLQDLPGLNVFHASCPAVCVSRKADLLADGNDDFILQWADAAGRYKHLKREIALQPGDATVLSCADPFEIRVPSDYALLSVRFSRARLRALLRDAESCLGRPIPANSGALRLLLGYVGILRDRSLTATHELRSAAAAHIYDLAAIALGATGDAAEAAGLGGVPAARLLFVKKYIGARLADGDLSIAAVAASHKLTPRSVQLLFEREGLTFTAYLREQRLALAYRMLASPQHSGLRIGDIVFACGFGDVSSFNRAFRARYGATPSDIRNGNKSQN